MPAQFFGPSVGPYDYITTEQLVRDTIELTKNLPAETDAVVAVARSGFLPGSIIATSLHVPIFTVSRNGVFTNPGAGGRMTVPLAQPPRHPLIVDDTAFAGRAMAYSVAKVKRSLPKADIKRVVIYSTPGGQRFVDYAYSLAPGVHFLEWNWANSIHSAHSGFDFDGIFCEDCPVADDDNGPRYMKFLTSARPLYLPRRKVARIIVTARREKYRKETEEWLRRYRISYRTLVMRDFEVPHGRRWAEVIGAWKATQFGKHRLMTVAESDVRQAAIIHEKTGLCVICPGAKKVFPPSQSRPRPAVI